MKSLNGLLYEVHRWLGVILGLFMFAWFFSGLLIMYSAPITVMRSQALAHAELLIPKTGWLSLGQVWDTSKEQRKALSSLKANKNNNERPANAANNAGDKGGKNATPIIVEAKLVSQNANPVWLVEDSRNQRYALSAIDGSLQETSAEQALKIAENWLRIEGRENFTINYVELIDETILLRNRDALQPFHKIAVDETGEQLLISARTGEVLHSSTAWQRTGFWLGNFIHLFKPLDVLGFKELRHDVQLWAGLSAFIACLTGLIIGWQRWRPGLNGRRTYSEGRSHPYREFWLKWHFWVGLLGGVFALSWAFSGFISTNPGKVFTQAEVTKEELRRYLGDMPDVVKQWQANEQVAKQVVNLVELNWRYLGEEAVLTAYSRDGERWPQNIDTAQTQVSEANLKKAIERVSNSAALKSLTLQTTYDNYYYPNHDQGLIEKPLPVVNVVLDDSAATQYYLDAKDGRILARLDQSRRYYRWLYSALHHWDFGFLHQRPLWDVWMLTWVGFGLVLGSSALVLGWRRLQKTFRRKRSSKHLKQNFEEALASENSLN